MNYHKFKKIPISRVELRQALSQLKTLLPVRIRTPQPSRFVFVIHLFNSLNDKLDRLKPSMPKRKYEILVGLTWPFRIAAHKRAKTQHNVDLRVISEAEVAKYVETNSFLSIR